MNARSTAAAAGGRRRRPIWAPIDRADGDQRRDPPVDVGDQDEDHRRDAVDEPGEDVLDRVVPLQGRRRSRAQDGHQQDALGGAEVAAVHPGQRRPPATATRRRAGQAAARARARRATRR